MSLSRRSFLRSSGALLTAGALGGCGLFTKKPRPVCPFDPAFTDPETMLAIDVHAHIFNATDLQVRDFVSRVAVGQSGGIGQLAEFFGGLLQTFAWSSAPDVTREARVLADLEPVIRACEPGENVARLRALRQQQYADGKVELDEAVRVRMQELVIDPDELDAPLESLDPQSSGFKQILSLPDSYDALQDSATAAEPGLESFPEAISVGSALRFLVEMFQYRFVSVYNYLETYGGEPDIRIDLMTPATVDYDWWLSQGRPTRSSLPEQMALMKQVSILTGGRVHALVAFDPFRQVVHDLSLDSGFDPLGLVRASVGEYGAIGIKLYPPMGFAPYGNRAVGQDRPDMWRQASWLPEVAHRDDFPARLDAALERLYEYCAANGVPVMGHSSESNGPLTDFEGLTAPGHWERATERFEEVSFSFGHFGGAGSTDGDDTANAEGFLELMDIDRRDGRRRLAADASYFSNILEDPQRLANALQAILEFGGPGNAPAADRLMYGADWKMLVAELGSQGYLRDFSEVMAGLQDRLDIPRLRQKFFGLNAAEFLGLGRNRENRRRLENFYDRNGMERAPTWMEKIDREA